MDSKIATGVIRTSFGLKGFLKLKVYSDDYKHFKKLKEVTLKKGNSSLVVVIEALQIKGDSLLVKFEGYDTPEKSRNLNGYEIYINRDEAASLKENECYVSDLIGLKVLYEGKQVGKIGSFLDKVDSVLLEIVTDGGSYFIPYESRFFENRNLEKGCITIKEIELIS